MKDWIKRSLRTFIQTAAGFAATNLLLYVPQIGDTNFDAIKTSLIGLATAAVAAGIAAAMNYKKEENHG